MKVMMKKITTIVIATALVCVCLVGCGAISIDEIKGEWTLDTINDQSLADYAASTGVDVNTIYSNWTIKDDKTIEATTAYGSGTISMELKSNGFEATEDASGSKMSVEYNKDAGTLTYKVDVNGTVNTCVMKKGTFTPTTAEESTDEESSDVEESSDEESGDVEESSDEGTEDEVYDEEGYDEESYDESSDEGNEEETE